MITVHIDWAWDGDRQEAWANFLEQASGHGVSVQLVRERSPSGWPEVTVSGDRDSVVQALTAWGYDDQASEL